MFKLIFAIIRDNDANGAIEALLKGNFRVTRIASTGAFFREGNTTLIVGVEESKLDAAIETLKLGLGTPPTDGSHRATIFVLNAARHEQI